MTGYNDLIHDPVLLELTNRDGNAFAIMGRTAEALRRAGCNEKQIDEYTGEATSGDYDHLLQVTLAWADAYSIEVA